MSTTPNTPTQPRPELAPVKARLLEGAVTGCAPPPPPPAPVAAVVTGAACVVLEERAVVVVPGAAVVVVDPDVVVEPGAAVEVVLEGVPSDGGLVVEDVSPPADVVDEAGGAEVGVDVGGSVVAVVGVVEGVVGGVEVDVEAVDVEGVLWSDTAITGARGGPLGAGVPVGSRPSVGMVSFGYDVHVNVRGEPPTISVREVAESSCTVTPSPDAVKGPRVAGLDGTVRVTPPSGTGLGIVTLKSSVPVARVAGVRPDTSSCPVADPASVGESAAAAVANVLGRTTDVW